MQIRSRVTVSIFLLILVVCSAIAFTSYILHQYTDSVRGITDTRVSREQLLLEGQSLVANIHTSVLESFTLHTAEDSDTLAELDRTAVSFYQSIEKLNDEEFIDHDSLRSLNKSFQTYYLFSKRLLLRVGNTTPSNDSVIHFKKMYRELIVELQTVFSKSDKLLVKRVNSINETIDRLRKLFIGLSVIALLFVVGIGMGLIKSVVSPLNQLSKTLKDYENGQPFHAQETHSADELGLIRQAFDSIAKTLHDREQRLETAASEFKALFDNSWEGIARTSTQGTLLEASPGMLRLFGYDAHEEITSSELDIHDFYNDPKLHDEIIKRLEQGEELVEYEGRFARRDGTLFWGRVRARLNKTPQETPIGVDIFITDISFQKKESQLQIAKEEAEFANAAKSDFLATMSHEIRTPITAMLGMAEILDGTDKSERQEQCIKAILGAGNQLLTLIGDILSFSEIESGHIKLQKVPFELSALLTDLESVFKPLCNGKGVHFEIVADKGRPPVLIGDDARVRQILVNLIGNAIKFTDSGYIRLSVNCDQQSERVEFQVEDTGVGIPAELQEQIFAPFVQNEKSTTRRFGGSGLGLAIAHKVTKAMGGEITVHSQVGIGSTFTVRLALPRGTAADLQHTAPKGRSSTTLQGKHILVVDDSESNRNIIEVFLGKAGAKTTMAEGGEEGIQLARDNRFDAILMDIEMPRINGLEATRRIREHEQGNGLAQVPIVIVTAHVFDEFKQQSASAGCDDYLAKPFSKKELVAVLEKHVG